MADNKHWGGSRSNAGRKAIDESQKKVQMSLKVDCDNNAFFQSDTFAQLDVTKNRFINDALRCYIEKFSENSKK